MANVWIYFIMATLVICDSAPTGSMPERRRLSPLSIKPNTFRPFTIKPITWRPITFKPITWRPITFKPITWKPIPLPGPLPGPGPVCLSCISKSLDTILKGVEAGFRGIIRAVRK